MDSDGRYREPAAGLGVWRSAAWLAGHALFYLVLCLFGWFAVALLFGGISGGLLGVVAYLWVFVTFYGILFGLPTLLVLVVLRFVGQRMSAWTFRRTALVVLPLIAVVLPVELPPNAQYGVQLLVQVPIQVVFALLLRPPSVESEDTDDDLLPEWGLTKRTVKPHREPFADAETLPGTAAGPGRSWYAILLGVSLWLALLFTGGRPLLLDWVPLGPQRAAHPISQPGETVRFVAHPGRQYLIYQDHTSPAGSGETCRYGATDLPRLGSWVWSRPPERVTHDGHVFRYRGVVSGVDGVYEMSCDSGPLLVEDSPALAASPAGPAAVAAVSLPIPASCTLPGLVGTLGCDAAATAVRLAPHQRNLGPDGHSTRQG